MHGAVVKMMQMLLMTTTCSCLADKDVEAARVSCLFSTSRLVKTKTDHIGTITDSFAIKSGSGINGMSDI